MEYLITPETLKPHLLQRENNSHKGDYGHLLLVCGCQRMPGAAVLATGAALHSGPSARLASLRMGLIS